MIRLAPGPMPTRLRAWLKLAGLTIAKIDARRPALAWHRRGSQQVPDTTDSTNDFIGEDILRRRVMALIDQHCVSCHDEPDHDGKAPGITQIEWLLSEGWVIPGSSEDSLLLPGFENGHAQLGQSGPTIGEIALIEPFIDPSALAELECPVRDDIDSDVALASATRDIASLPVSDRHPSRSTLPSSSIAWTYATTGGTAPSTSTPKLARSFQMAGRRS